VVSPNPLRERVCRACFLLHILTAHVIPDTALQNRLIAIMADYEKNQPDDVALSHLNDQEILHIASEIVSIYEGCIKL
jgi:F420-0:gamma-glutamyl ligase